MEAKAAGVEAKAAWVVAAAAEAAAEAGREWARRWNVPKSTEVGAEVPSWPDPD